MMSITTIAIIPDVSLDNPYKDRNLSSKISADITGATADGTNVTFTANPTV